MKFNPNSERLFYVTINDNNDQQWAQPLAVLRAHLLPEIFTTTLSIMPRKVSQTIQIKVEQVP